MNFRDYHNNKLTIKEIAELVTNNHDEYRFYIGTDSQVKNKEKKVVYATCIVLYHINKGGRIFVSRRKSKILSSLKERLSTETWRSIEVALALQNETKSDIIIHIDVNKSNKHKSGEHHQELASMVTSQGFKVEIKPDAWTSSSVADRFCRTQND